MTMLLSLACLILFDLSRGFLWPSKVCYWKYGCFHRHPNLLVFSPQKPSQIGTSFLLFTRNNRQTAHIIDDRNVNKLKNSFFKIHRRTILLVHGFTVTGETGSLNIQIKNALLNREDCNVILVDWSKGADFPYGQAAGNTRLVGAQIAELIRSLITKTKSPSSVASRFYIVGHSLGAHTAGYAGSYLRARGIGLGRITGLDPAALLFTKVRTSFRLDASDAKYVDVIHTDAGFYGTKLISGHADFYPNGGRHQAGCPFDVIHECDHMRALRYYIESVKRSCSWRAYPCPNYDTFKKGRCLSCNGACPSMGHDADRTKKKGKFYLQTNSNAPYCGKTPRGR